MNRVEIVFLGINSNACAARCHNLYVDTNQDSRVSFGFFVSLRQPNIAFYASAAKFNIAVINLVISCAETVNCELRKLPGANFRLGPFVFLFIYLRLWPRVTCCLVWNTWERSSLCISTYNDSFCFMQQTTVLKTEFKLLFIFQLTLYN